MTGRDVSMLLYVGSVYANSANSTFLLNGFGPRRHIESLLPPPDTTTATHSVQRQTPPQLSISASCTILFVHHPLTAQIKLTGESAPQLLVTFTYPQNDQSNRHFINFVYEVDLQKKATVRLSKLVSYHISLCVFHETRATGPGSS